MNTILQWKAYEWSIAFLFIKSLLSTPSTLYFSNWAEIFYVRIQRPFIFRGLNTLLSSLITLNTSFPSNIRSMFP